MQLFVACGFVHVYVQRVKLNEVLSICFCYPVMWVHFEKIEPWFLWCEKWLELMEDCCKVRGMQTGNIPFSWSLAAKLIC